MMIEMMTLIELTMGLKKQMVVQGYDETKKDKEK